MSLILDALKQSEKDRQQQTESIADTLYIQVKPKHHSVWPIALTLLLLANIGILLFLWWHTPDARSAAEPANARAIIENARLASPKPAARPVVAAAPAPKTASRILRPLQQELGSAKVVELHPSSSKQQADSTTAVEKKPATPPPLTPQPQAADGDTLQQLRQYEINTIVYSDSPSRRYALINMQKFKEGATLPQSKLRIRQITTDGLIIDTGNGLVSYSGTP